MRSLILAVALGFCQAVVAGSTDSPGGVSAELEQGTAPQPRILWPDEGEKLIKYGGRHVLLKATAEDAGASELFMGTETLPSGSAIPVHSHDGYEEIIFLHQGNARLTLGDREVDAEPGTTMFIPAGTWHGVESTDASETIILFIFPEPAMEEFFRSVGHKEGEPPPDLNPEDWQSIMEKHQMRARRD